MSKEVFDDFMKKFEEHMKYTKVEGQIEFPIEISAVRHQQTLEADAELIGKWVSIRPVSAKATYLGVYLGDLGRNIMHSYNTQSKELTVLMHRNPAIYVPDLKMVIWGDSSWWGVIRCPEDLRQITDSDIQNIWYVKALKELSEVTVSADTSAADPQSQSESDSSTVDPTDKSP